MSGRRIEGVRFRPSRPLPHEAFIVNLPSSPYEHEGPDALDLPYESDAAAAIVPWRWWATAPD